MASVPIGIGAIVIAMGGAVFVIAPPAAGAEVVGDIAGTLVAVVAGTVVGAVIGADVVGCADAAVAAAQTTTAVASAMRRVCMAPSALRNHICAAAAGIGSSRSFGYALGPLASPPDKRR
jgi:hypothetical protein